MELLPGLCAYVFICCNLDVIVYCWTVGYRTVTDSRSPAINLKPGGTDRKHPQHKLGRSSSDIQFFYFLRVT